jgi:hypothetical protein
MKKPFLALALLAGCATTNPQGKIAPRQNRIDPAPAIALLQATRFDDAEAKAREIVAKEPPNSQANAVVAIARYKRTLHQLVQDVISIGMGIGQTHLVNYDYLKHALSKADEGFTWVEKHLAAAGTDSNFALHLCLACWRYDWNHNGRIEVDAAGNEIPEQDPRRKPTFRFDLGDVHWARAMVMFQHAALNVVMAYDSSEIGNFLVLRGRDATPATFTLRLVDKARIHRARQLILDGLAAAELARQLYLAETDDANEWVPNPRQKNHPLPLPVDEALYETWGLILADVARLVRGEEGLSVAELAQLGDHRWQTPPQGYVNLGPLLDQPGDIVFHTKTFEELDRMSGENPALIERILRETFGDKYRSSMKPSLLPSRLQRMKQEIERGHESLERKLRYLLWLN